MPPAPFGIYIHIPYCLQRCTYCDFATYEQSQILPPDQYVELVLEEMNQKLSSLQGRKISTVYFGGGTPSLIPAPLILALKDGLEKRGLQISSEAEVTLEINPATLDRKKMDLYMAAGFNRFSVGAQTFDDVLLKMVHREHSAEQTRETLRFLKSEGVNYSFDVLFALPHQSLDGLKRDLDEISVFDPPHVSPYCLTVPEGHILTKNRPLEDDQLEMFDLISKRLLQLGHSRYEISNFAKPGFESKHNSLYWDNSEYLGLGLSAHSYLHQGRHGVRFWNESGIAAYQEKIEGQKGKIFQNPIEALSEKQFEKLEAHQALTDFCHVTLRTQKGLSESLLEQRFGSEVAQLVCENLAELQQRGWVEMSSQVWRLTEEGVLISNQVFAALTYLSNELPKLGPSAP